MPDDLGQGKVAQLGVPLLVQKHVAGLDVAVHHLHVQALVQVGQAGEGEEGAGGTEQQGVVQGRGRGGT